MTALSPELKPRDKTNRLNTSTNKLTAATLNKRQRSTPDVRTDVGRQSAGTTSPSAAERFAALQLSLRTKNPEAILS